MTTVREKFDELLKKMILTPDANREILEKNIVDKEKINEFFTESFDSTLIYLKVTFLILFIVMSIGNGYTDYIRSKPFSFTIESIIYGILGAIPFLYMEEHRKSPSAEKHYLKIFLVLFLVYAIFNVLLELSGAYYFLYENHATAKNQPKAPALPTKEDTIYNNIVNSIFYTITIILLYMIFTMIIISFRVHNFDIAVYKDHFYSSFTQEILIFGLLNALPFFFIAYNREGHHFNLKRNTIEVILIFIKFVILHLMLQGSGYYHEMLGY
jgi:hypothetical protein